MLLFKFGHSAVMEKCFIRASVKDRTHDATLRAILRAIAELHCVHLCNIVACNIARNVAGVGVSSTVSASHVT